MHRIMCLEITLIATLIFVTPKNTSMTLILLLNFKIASNSESLILDVTNNTVEQFNNVIAKFIGCKRVNYTARGSYQTRCLGAVISWNSDMAIHSRLSKKNHGCSPGKYTKKKAIKRKQ